MKKVQKDCSAVFFTAAVKKQQLQVCSCFFGQIAMKMFVSEEVGAWSALKSPRVVELFGVIKDGPNVVLLMDLKSGK